MITIDLNRIREALPKRAKVSLGKTKNGTPYIECKVFFPSLYDKGTKEEQEDVDRVFEWQREIIGNENISEFYTESTGAHWFVYLERKAYDFINLTDSDVNNFTGLELAK
jgi:hypothetical protein